MSVNKAWNAAIAVIEDRIETAREYLRSPELEGVNLTELCTRLRIAIGGVQVRTCNETIKAILSESLRLEPPVGVDREAYYRGINDLEKILERHVTETTEEDGD